MNTATFAVAAAAAAAGASVVYAIMSSRRTITYDSSSDEPSSPLPVTSSSVAPPHLHLPLARDHDGGNTWLPVQPSTAHASASRQVIKADALEWLKQQSTLPGSVVTLLPDIGELKLSHEQCGYFLSMSCVALSLSLSLCNRYEPWFQAACDLLFSKIAPGQFAIFYQTDIKMLEADQVRSL